MKYFHSGYFKIGGQKLYVSRTGFTNELGYEIYTGAQTDHLALWDHLMACGAPHGRNFHLRAPSLSDELREVFGKWHGFNSDMTPFEAL